LWSALVAADKNFKANMSLSEKLFTHIGNFRKDAVSTLKEIVNELHLPLS